MDAWCEACEDIIGLGMEGETGCGRVVLVDRANCSLHSSTACFYFASARSFRATGLTALTPVSYVLLSVAQRNPHSQALDCTGSWVCLFLYLAEHGVDTDALARTVFGLIPFVYR
jgi:hypothetical protein